MDATTRHRHVSCQDGISAVATAAEARLSRPIRPSGEQPTEGVLIWQAIGCWHTAAQWRGMPVLTAIGVPSGDVLKSVNVSSLAGQTVSISFTGAEDSSLQTSFVIDDTALTLS